ncbi:MAG: FAD-dependent oxidoreductase [Arenicellales bacterium]
MTQKSIRNRRGSRNAPILSPGANIAVIGAGIVGTCCAAELCERGYRVTLFDRGAPGQEGASRGNAGQIVPSLILPVGYPGIARHALGMLLDPHSPLSIPPSYMPRLLPWLMRFLAASRRRNYQRGIESLASLNARALEATRDLYRRADLLSSLRRTGALYLYESAGSLARAGRDWAVKGRHGYDHEFIGPDRIQAMEPALARAFMGAVFEKSLSHVADPLGIVEGVFRYAASRGTVLHQGEARIGELSSEGIVVHTADGARYSFDGLVIAAGAWSGSLLKQIGDDILLESERGYNTTIERPGVEIRHCLVFVDRGFVASPLAPGLRIGGCVELAGLDAPPNPRRIERILEVARRFIPELDDSGGRTWMGHRPATPDSVPVIRPSSSDERIVYAFGHGHLGLTQGPLTGRMVAELFSGAS